MHQLKHCCQVTVTKPMGVSRDKVQVMGLVEGKGDLGGREYKVQIF